MEANMEVEINGKKTNLIEIGVAMVNPIDKKLYWQNKLRKQELGSANEKALEVNRDIKLPEDKSKVFEYLDKLKNEMFDEILKKEVEWAAGQQFIVKKIDLIPACEIATGRRFFMLYEIVSMIG